MIWFTQLSQTVQLSFVALLFFIGICVLVLGIRGFRIKTKDGTEVETAPDEEKEEVKK